MEPLKSDELPPTVSFLVATGRTILTSFHMYSLGTKISIGLKRYKDSHFHSTVQFVPAQKEQLQTVIAVVLQGSSNLQGCKFNKNNDLGLFVTTK